MPENRMRLLITGGRDHGGREAVFMIADALKGLDPEVVIVGGARGADTIAEGVAESFGYPVQVFPADWSKYGKAAGNCSRSTG